MSIRSRRFVALTACVHLALVSAVFAQASTKPGIGAIPYAGGTTFRVWAPNAQSVALHEKLGFKQVAQFKDIGFKLNRWIDVGYWQLQLDKPLVPRLKPNFIKDEPCL